MKVVINRPYFYFGYKDEPGGVSYKAILLNIITRKFKNLVKFDLQNDKELRRHSMPLQHLMNAVDLAQRITRLNQLIAQLEVISDLVNRSLATNEKDTCTAFSKVAERLSDYEEEAHYRREDYYKAMKDESARPIRKFKAMFAYYDELYKDYYSIASTFPVTCHDIMLNKAKSISDYLELESKEKIDILSSPILLTENPISILTKGCERHIRNAISHENRHSFIENNTKARLVDINPKGKVVYDRVFTIKEFEEVLRDLMVTILALKTALVLFNINQIREINTYLPKKIFSNDDIEKIAFVCAKDSFIDYQSMKLTSPKNANFIVKVQPRRKIKNVTVSAGPFSRTVDIPEIPSATQQLARFLQLVYHYTDKTFEHMGVTLINLDDEIVGEFCVNTKNFSIKDVNIFITKATKNSVPKDYQLES